jgi:hypothetical protein
MGALCATKRFMFTTTSIFLYLPTSKRICPMFCAAVFSVFIYKHVSYKSYCFEYDIIQLFVWHHTNHTTICMMSYKVPMIIIFLPYDASMTIILRYYYVIHWPYDCVWPKIWRSIPYMMRHTIFVWCMYDCHTRIIRSVWCIIVWFGVLFSKI